MIKMYLVLLWIFLGWIYSTGQTYPPETNDPFNLRKEIGGFRRDPTAPIMITGTHSFMSGSQDGTFPFVKKWIRNQNGVWVPPIRILDGIYFQLNSEPGRTEELWRPQAIFVSPVSNIWRYLIADANALVYREDFCPDGERGLYIKLTIEDIRSEDEATDNRVMGWRCLIREDVSPSFFADRLQQYDSEDHVWKKDGILCAKDRIQEWYGGVTSIPAPKYLNWEGTDTRIKKHVDAHLGNGRWGEFMVDVTVPAGGKRSIWIVVGGTSISEEEFFYRMRRLRESDPEKFLADKKVRVSDLLDHTNLKITDKDIEQAFYWMKANLAMMDLYVPIDTYHHYDIDPEKDPEPLHGLVAGYPWYSNWFSNDGCYAILGLLTVGQHEVARSHLKLIGSISRHVNKNGSILHEVTLSGKNIGYGNMQETGQYIHTLRDYVKWTGDLDLARDFYDYCKVGFFDYLLGERNKDGDELPQGPGIAEVANLDGKVIDTAVHTCMAADAMSEMANWFGEEEVSQRAAAIYNRLKEKIRTQFWIEEIGEFGDNIAPAKRWVEILPDMIRRGRLQAATNIEPLKDLYQKAKNMPPDQDLTGQYGKMWIATVMSSGIATDEQALKQIKVFEDKFAGRWGIHGTWRTPTYAMTITTGEYLNAILRYGQVDLAVPWLHKLAYALSLKMPGAITEMAPDGGCTMQSWTAYGIHYAIVDKMIGIKPDAIKKTISIAPQIPAAWKPKFGANRIKIADIMLDVIHEFKAGIWQTTITTEAQGWMINYKAPLGQDKISLNINGETHSGEKMIKVSL